MDLNAAQLAVQHAANCQLNKTISDLPKLYGTAKDIVRVENLHDHIDALIHAFAWTQEMAFNYFRMALQSSDEIWITLVCETDEAFQPT